jgi:hypothetical protein
MSPSPCLFLLQFSAKIETRKSKLSTPIHPEKEQLNRYSQIMVTTNVYPTKFINNSNPIHKNIKTQCIIINLMRWVSIKRNK